MPKVFQESDATFSIGGGYDTIDAPTFFYKGRLRYETSYGSEVYSGRGVIQSKVGPYKARISFELLSARNLGSGEFHCQILDKNRYSTGWTAIKTMWTPNGLNGESILEIPDTDNVLVTVENGKVTFNDIVYNLVENDDDDVTNCIVPLVRAMRAHKSKQKMIARRDAVLEKLGCSTGYCSFCENELTPESTVFAHPEHNICVECAEFLTSYQ